jgi:hypothetical protein
MSRILRLCGFIIVMATFLSVSSCPLPEMEWVSVHPYSATSNPLPEFGLNWTSLDSSSEVMVSKDNRDIVYFAGIAYYSAGGDAGNGTSLFQLQEDYRPAVTLEIPITIRTSAPSVHPGYLIITTTGYVVAYNYDVSQLKQIALDGISFLVQ